MLPGNAILTLQALYLNNTTNPPDGQPDISALFTAGEQVSATVVGALGNGRFAVQVNNQLLDLNLPTGATAGEKLDLTVVANRPTLTFALANSESPDFHPGVQTEFSGGARYLSDLLSNNGKAATSGAQNAAAAAPLFEGTPNTADLATKLAQTLGQSGLFYESHQAQWVDGQRSLQSLQQEPQAKLQLTSTSASVADAKPDTTNPAVLPAKEASPQDAAMLKQVASVAVDVTSASISRLASGQDQQAVLAGLVQRQLDAIDRQAIMWHGLAWPGQPMQWSVQGDDHNQNQAYADPEDRQWRTTLNLQLPRLGQISINAVLSQGQFNLSFKAAPETVQQLQSAQSALGTQFEGAGLALAAVSFSAASAEATDGE